MGVAGRATADEAMNAASWCSEVSRAVTTIIQEREEVVRREPHPKAVRSDILISLVAWGIYGIPIQPLKPCQCVSVKNALPSAGPSFLQNFGEEKVLPAFPASWASLDVHQKAEIDYSARELWASVPAEALTVSGGGVLQVGPDVLVHPCGVRFRDYLRDLHQRNGDELSAHFVPSLKSSSGHSTGMARAMQQLVAREALKEGGIFHGGGQGISFRRVVAMIGSFVEVHPCSIREDETEMIRMKMDMVVLLEQHTRRSPPPGLPTGRRFSTAPIVFTSTPGVVCGMQRMGSGRHVVIAPLSAQTVVSRLRPAGPEDLDALFGYDSGGRNMCVGAWMAQMTQTLNVCRDSRTVVFSTTYVLVPSSVLLVAAPSASAPVRVVVLPVGNDQRQLVAPPPQAAPAPPPPPPPPTYTTHHVCCAVM